MLDSRLKVMLVDDDEDDYRMTRDVLSGAELGRVDLNWVGSYDRALDSMPKNEHDVYLVDVRLGEGDGIDLVRQSARKGCKGPFIVLSGCMGERFDAALDAGASDFLSKETLSPPLLARSIRFAMEYSQALANLARTDAETEQLFSRLSAVLVGLSSKGEVTRWNRAAEQVFGLPAQAAIGKRFAELPIAWSKSSSGRIARIAAGKCPASPCLELNAAGEKGKARALSVMLTDVRPSGNSQTVRVLLAQDVTEHKQLEDQLRHAQKMEAVGRLAGGVAHEFNNLLQVITAYTTYALECLPAEGDLHSDMRQVLRASETASRLASDLLAFGRQKPVRRARIDLNDSIGELVNTLRPLLGRSIDLCFKPDSRDCVLHADSEMLQQAVLNLCLNARDAMPCGGEISIETQNVLLDRRFCETHAHGRPGRYVLIRVSDTGSGIPPAHLGRIFEPFFTTKESGKGNGLGLATVYANVEQHGGFIEVESGLASGTVFSVYLPKEQRKAGRRREAGESRQRGHNGGVNRFHPPHDGSKGSRPANEN